MKLQKGSEPLGISIVSGEKGGVYVSKVTGGSIAHQAGLEYKTNFFEDWKCFLFFFKFKCVPEGYFWTWASERLSTWLKPR